MPARVLVVEDDRNLAKLLRHNLESEGYRVAVAFDGEQGASQWRAARHDLVVLDIKLPGMDGLQVLKEIRREGSTPVVLLTARAEETDRLVGFDMGADDYLTKPFSVREFLARVRAVIRRSAAGGTAGSSLLRAGRLEMDAERYEVRVGGGPVALNSKEFGLLKALLEAGGRVLSRPDLLERVWGQERSSEIDTRTVDQHVARLRRKLGPEARRLVTVKTVGYALKTD